MIPWFSRSFPPADDGWGPGGHLPNFPSPRFILLPCHPSRKELPTGCVPALPSLHACCLPLSLATLRPPSWAPSRCQDPPLRFPTPSPPRAPPPPPLAARPAPILGHSCSPQTPEAHTPPTPPTVPLSSLRGPSPPPPNSWGCLETLLPTNTVIIRTNAIPTPWAFIPSIHPQAEKKLTPPAPRPRSTPLPELLTTQLSARSSLPAFTLSTTPPAAEVIDYPRSRIPTRKTTAAQDPDPNVR